MKPSDPTCAMLRIAVNLDSHRVNRKLERGWGQGFSVIINESDNSVQFFSHLSRIFLHFIVAKNIRIILISKKKKKEKFDSHGEWSRYRVMCSIDWSNRMEERARKKVQYNIVYLHRWDGDRKWRSIGWKWDGRAVIDREICLLFLIHQIRNRYLLPIKIAHAR